MKTLLLCLGICCIPLTVHGNRRPIPMNPMNKTIEPLTGQLGMTVTLDQAADSQRPVTVVNAKFSDDSVARPVTVSLFSDMTRLWNGVSVVPMLPVWAIITFGNAGFSRKVTIDVNAGITFMVNCSFIRVDLQVNDTFPIGAVGQVGAFVVPGPTNNGDLPTFDFTPALGVGGGYNNLVTPGNLSVWAHIPPFTKRVKVIPATPSTDSFDVEFVSIGGTFYRYSQFAGASPSLMDWTEITPYVQAIQIRNTGPADVVFYLLAEIDIN